MYARTPKWLFLTSGRVPSRGPRGTSSKICGISGSGGGRLPLYIRGLVKYAKSGASMPILSNIQFSYAPCVFLHRWVLKSYEDWSRQYANRSHCGAHTDFTLAKKSNVHCVTFLPSSMQNHGPRSLRHNIKSSFIPSQLSFAVFAEIFSASLQYMTTELNFGTF